MNDDPKEATPEFKQPESSEGSPGDPDLAQSTGVAQPDEYLDALANEYLAQLMAGNRRGAGQLVDDAIGGGRPIQDVYMNVFQSTQYEVGRRWQANKISVAQEHYCTASTQLIMDRLKGQVIPSLRKPVTLLLASVGEELHELGARMVTDFFEMNGWNTFYAGTDLGQESLIQLVRDRKPNVLGLSATMTPHVESIKKLIEAVHACDACRGTLILVGGRPFNLNPELWREVKADGWAKDAAAAVDLANTLLLAFEGREVEGGSI